MNEPSYAVAGTVVLFNPTDKVFDEISSYIEQVSRIYVIDNSVRYNDSLIRKLKAIKKIVYVNHEGNKGIASALNRGAQMALDDGFDFLLTMDQDTSLSANFVETLMKGTLANSLGPIGIIAPRYTKRSKKEADPFQNVRLTMTSGNILNLAVYKKTGPFLDELFIDHVDHEYCLRLNKLGFTVIQANGLEIEHRPGTIVQVSIFFRKLYFSSHSPPRLYYFCRNGFYVVSKYSKTSAWFRYFFYKLLLKEICKIPFEKDKMLRLRMIKKGFMDFKSEKLGALGE